MDPGSCQYAPASVGALLDRRPQSVDYLRCALVFRPHHPVGDEAETDPVKGVSKSDLPPCAVMPETAVTEVAPRSGIELKAIAPAGIRRLASKHRGAFALGSSRLDDNGIIDEPDAAGRDDRCR